jgi:hypothetical protein
MLLLLGFMLVLVPNFDPIFNSLAFGRGDEFIGYSLVVATGYVISAQVAKKAYIKLFDSWL